MMKHLLFLPLAAVAVLTGCTERVVYQQPPPPAPVYHPALPPEPALIVETPPPRPYVGAIWVRGHWRWNGRRYVWVRGHYRPA